MNFITKNKNRSYPKTAGKIFAVLFWIAVWQILYMIIQQEILIVSPARVLQRLYELSGSAEFWLSALYSMRHVLQGFVLGVIAGTFLAVLTSASKAMDDLFYPLVSIIKATPVVSFIILALVWIRSDRVPGFTAFLSVTPVVMSNVANGIHKTDRGLLQMAKCYRFGAWRTVRRVYVPSVMPYFTAACTTGMGFAWKTAIAAEVLSNTGISIGGKIYDAKVYLETADLFAWTAVVIVLSVILERLMMLLMRRIGQKYNVS